MFIFIFIFIFYNFKFNETKWHRIINKLKENIILLFPFLYLWTQLHFDCYIATSYFYLLVLVKLFIIITEFFFNFILFFILCSHFLDLEFVFISCATLYFQF
jgi:hypothetical protein